MCYMLFRYVFFSLLQDDSMDLTEGGVAEAEAAGAGSGQRVSKSKKKKKKHKAKHGRL